MKLLALILFGVVVAMFKKDAVEKFKKDAVAVFKKKSLLEDVEFDEDPMITMDRYKPGKYIVTMNASQCQGLIVCSSTDIAEKYRIPNYYLRPADIFDVDKVVITDKRIRGRLSVLPDPVKDQGYTEAWTTLYNHLEPTSDYADYYSAMEKLPINRYKAGYYKTKTTLLVSFSPSIDGSYIVLKHDGNPLRLAKGYIVPICETKLNGDRTRIRGRLHPGFLPNDPVWKDHDAYWITMRVVYHPSKYFTEIDKFKPIETPWNLADMDLWTYNNNAKESQTTTTGYPRVLPSRMWDTTPISMSDSNRGGQETKSVKFSKLGAPRQASRSRMKNVEMAATTDAPNINVSMAPKTDAVTIPKKNDDFDFLTGQSYTKATEAPLMFDLLDLFSSPAAQNSVNELISESQNKKQ